MTTISGSPSHLWQPPSLASSSPKSFRISLNPHRFRYALQPCRRRHPPRRCVCVCPRNLEVVVRKRIIVRDGEEVDVGADKDFIGENEKVKPYGQTK